MARRASFLRCSALLRLDMADRGGGRGHCRDRGGPSQLRPGLAGAALLAVLALAACSKADAPPPVGGARPGAAGSAEAVSGAALFDTHCSRCHGTEALGSDRGPPLVNRIYEPSHHPDAAFYQAVDHGVRAHHWRFGDMPRIGGLSNAEVTAIIGYVRERQRAAGIH